MFSSTKHLKLGSFHVLVVQERQSNVQKKADVQSYCCFANPNLLYLLTLQLSLPSLSLLLKLLNVGQVVMAQATKFSWWTGKLIYMGHSYLSQENNLIQGRPKAVFCKITLRRSKECLQFSIPQEGRLRISRWPFHSYKIFVAHLINPLQFFLKFNFVHFTPRIKLFFTEKGNLKFSDSKMRWKDESEKF